MVYKLNPKNNLYNVLKSQILFCEKYGINFNEYALFVVLLLAQEGDDPDLIQTYFQSRVCARGRATELLDGLREAGLIHKSYQVPGKGSTLDVNNVPLNKTVIKDYYKSSFVMGQELFDNYPQFGYIGANLVALRGISKKYDSLEDAFRAYGKAIRYNPDKHNEIIELLEWASDKQIINCSLASFIVNHGWEDLRALRDGDGANINYDSVKLV